MRLLVAVPIETFGFKHCGRRCPGLAYYLDRRYEEPRVVCGCRIFRRILRQGEAGELTHLRDQRCLDAEVEWAG